MPIGANHITRWTIFMIASLAAWKKSITARPFSPKVVTAAPNRRAKTISANTLVLLAARKMFDGTMPVLGGTEEAPPGEYTVRARFRYTLDIEGDPTMLEDEAVFTWDPDGGA